MKEHEKFWTGAVWVEKILRDDAYARICEWEKLNSDDWVKLIKCEPQYANICRWDIFDGEDLRQIFNRRNPYRYSLLEYIPRTRLQGASWSHLLQTFPDAGKYCNWEHLSGWSWCRLLCKQPQFSEHCDWWKLDGFDWATLLSKQPQFAEHCNWVFFSGNDWAELLCQQSQMSKYCKWEKLEWKNWEMILKFHPSIIDDNEEAQHTAVLCCKNAINHIRKPCQTTKQLHEMLWIL